MASLTERMVGAAKLDVATYEEVEHDASATSQAMLVVIAANLAAGVGALRELGIGGLLVTTLVALIGWYIWAFMLLLTGLSHPSPLNDITRLDPVRILVALFCVVLFVLIIALQPFPM